MQIFNLLQKKYLKQGCIENEASRGGNVIIMDPNTGDILAMATYPDYNLNSPYTPTHIDSKEWNKLSSEAQSNTYILYIRTEQFLTHMSLALYLKL